MRRLPLMITMVLMVGALACPKPKNQENASGTGTSPAKLKELTEIEPNDTVATAMQVNEAAHIAAQLKTDASKPDEDIFQIPALGASKVASFEVSGVPGADLALEVLDRDGNHVAVFNSEGDGKGEKTVNLNLAQPRLVKVYSAKKGSGGAYTATVTIADAQPDWEAEPNNRAVDATALVLQKPIKGLLSDRADEDWFLMEVPIPASPSPATGNAASPAPAPVPAPTAAPTPAPDGAAASGAADGADASAPPSANGSDTASGQDAARASASASAAVPAVLPAVVRIDVVGVPDVRLQLEVANQAQAVFYTAKSREVGEGIQVRNLALRPGESTYYLVIKSAWFGTGKEAKRGYNTSAPYVVTVSAEQAGADAELEPNDESTKATPLALDGIKQGFFAPKGDVDYYQVKCDRPSLLKIDLSGVDRVDSVLWLVKPAGEDRAQEEVLIKANDGGVREGEVLVNVGCGPGHDAFLRVDAAPRLVEKKWVRDQENSTEPYKLTVTSRPDTGVDEREPNNSAAAATPVELGKPIKGLIHPKKDADFYRVDLSKNPVKTAIMARVTGILKVDVALALYRQEEDGKTTLIQRADKAKADQPETIRYTVEPGIYLLEVRDTRNLQSNYLDAYQLTVEQEQ